MINFFFFLKIGFQSYYNITHGNSATVNKLKNIKDISKKKKIPLKYLGINENHIVPIVNTFTHVEKMTKHFLELGPSQCGTSKIIRCYDDITQNSDETNRTLFAHASETLVQLTKIQKEILQQLHLNNTKLDALAADNKKLIEENRRLSEENNAKLDALTKENQKLAEQNQKLLAQLQLINAQIAALPEQIQAMLRAQS